MSKNEALPITVLAEKFASLPGIGRKSAKRIAYYILSLDEESVKDFADAIVSAKRDVHKCKICCNFTENEICDICNDESRDKSTICVVESSADISAIEKTGDYNGVYHVLHGLISPMDGITPEMIEIKPLLSRIQNGGIHEVIMATNPTVEGDATAMYIASLLKSFGVKVTRLAFGLPVGGNLEYADEVTLNAALENRNDM